VTPLPASAVQREERLRGVAQRVRNRHADPPVAHIEPHHAPHQAAGLRIDWAGFCKGRVVLRIHLPSVIVTTLKKHYSDSNWSYSVKITWRQNHRLNLEWTTMPAIDPTFVRKHFVIFLLIVVNISAPVFVLLQRNSSGLTDNASIWVGWISVVLLNVVFLTAMHMRTRRTVQMVSRRSILIACVLTILSGLITTVSISATPKDNYLQLALSPMPLSKIQPERKRLIVELLRRDAANSAENNRIAKTIKPISPPLYSINSFASKAAMESTSSQLKTDYEIDCAYSTAKHQASFDFHNKMLKVDPEYLREFETKMHDDDVLEATIETAEEKWVTSALNLYDYAVVNASNISVNDGGHLVIADNGVRQSLLDQINASTALQQTMMDARAKAVNKQHSLQDALGVKHSD
jgi:hypothetical protein